MTIHGKPAFRVRQVLLTYILIGGSIALMLLIVDSFSLFLKSLWSIPIYREVKRLREKVQPNVMSNVNLESRKVAVLIPARNAEPYIKHVLRSVVSQTLPPKIIVVLDDCSTDNTSTAAKSFIESIGAETRGTYRQGVDHYEYHFQSSGASIRIFIVRFSSRMGKARALNAALQEFCHGVDYVLVLDSDTMIEKCYLAKIVGRMESEPSVAAAGGRIRLWNPSRKKGLGLLFVRAFRNLNFQSYSLLLKRTESIHGALIYVNGCCAVYKYEKLMEVGGFPTDTVSEDTAVTLELIMHGAKAAFYPEALALTADEPSIILLSKRMFRWAKGSYQNLIMRFKRMMATRARAILATVLYSYLGGLTFVIDLMDIPLSFWLYKYGFSGAGLLFKIAYAFHLSWLSAAAGFMSSNPILALSITYLMGVAGMLLLNIYLIVLYRDRKIGGEIRQGIIYTPIGAVLVWWQSILCLAAFINVIVESAYNRFRLRLTALQLTP